MTLVSLTGACVGGKYEVRRELGRGPRGTFYVCHDISNDALVALKVPHPQLMASESFRTQFWLELVAAGHLRSTNLVPLTMFGEDLELGTYYVASPYNALPDLATVLRENGALSDPICVEIIKRVVEALAIAHAGDVCHLNLKPTNVLVSLASGDAPRVRLADFGFSHLPDTTGRYGTAEYGAPEQAAGLSFEPRSDLYSVGVMLYEMLTCRLPFEASSASEVVRMHCGVAPPPPSGFRRVSPALESVCLKALSKTPDARFQSAHDMLDALEAIGELSAPRVRVRREHDSLAPIEQATDETRLKVPKRRAGALIAATAAAACVGWVGYGPIVEFVRHVPQKLDASAVAALVAPARPTFVLPEKQEQETAPDAPEPDAPEPEVPEPEVPETPQLVTTQNDAPPPPQPSAAGSVTLGAALPRTEAVEQLRSALDLSAITQCYRESLTAGDARNQRFGARLDLETSVDGRVRWSKLRAPELPLAARQCIERATLTARVADVGGVNVGASVFARFDPR